MLSSYETLIFLSRTTIVDHHFIPSKFGEIYEPVEKQVPFKVKENISLKYNGLSKNHIIIELSIAETKVLRKTKVLLKTTSLMSTTQVS